METVKGWIRQNKMAALLIVIYGLSLIPLFMASVYAYPQADDWTYSWRTHAAWEDSHSLLEVGKAVGETLEDSYANWQGTFSSIALMSLQPAVFGERLYALTPFIMIGMLTAATLVFFRELFRDVKGSEWLCMALLVLLVTVQRMVCVPVAFYWYNGAVHYLFMYGVGLFLAAFLMKVIRGKRPGSFWERKEARQNVSAIAVSCILAVVLGGGNLVTALSGAIGFVTVLAWLWLSGRRGKLLAVLLPALCNFAAFAANIAAPGNWVRQDAMGGQESPVMSVLRSLYYGLEFPAMQWMDWTVLLLVLLLIPVAWRAAGKTEFAFRYPLLAAAYSYCFVSAMFTPMDFAAHTVGIGRVQNAIFSTHILALVLNVFYLTGWCRKHVSLSLSEEGKKRFSRKLYYVVLAVGGLWCFGLSAVPSPEYFASTLALHDMWDGSARELAQTVEWNIESLQEEGSEADVYAIPRASRLLTSDDIDQWHFGTKYFYGKDKVNVLPRPEEEK